MTSIKVTYIPTLHKPLWYYAERPYKSVSIWEWQELTEPLRVSEDEHTHEWVSELVMVNGLDLDRDYCKTCGKEWI